jgi:hypothetical protein
LAGLEPGENPGRQVIGCPDSLNTRRNTLGWKKWKVVKNKMGNRIALAIMTAIAIGLIGWLIEQVFGRTHTPVHPKYTSSQVTQTWDGRKIVHMRSDPVGALHW